MFIFFLPSFSLSFPISLLNFQNSTTWPFGSFNRRSQNLSGHRKLQACWLKKPFGAHKFKNFQNFFENFYSFFFLLKCFFFSRHMFLFPWLFLFISISGFCLGSLVLGSNRFMVMVFGFGGILGICVWILWVLGLGSFV